MLEWAKVFGHYYGTPKAQVKQGLRDGQDFLFDILLDFFKGGFDGSGESGHAPQHCLRAGADAWAVPRLQAPTTFSTRALASTGG